MFLSESWWARYFPQTYFLVLIVLFYLYKLKNNTTLVLISMLTTLLLYNNFITFKEAVNYAYEFKNDINMQFAQIKELLKDDNELLIASSAYVRALYNVSDIFKEYKVEIVDPQDDLTDY